jgi:hypothetical protein
MKKIKNILLISFLFILTIVQAQVTDKLSIKASDIQLTTQNKYDRISWKNSQSTTEIGKPELPVYIETYVIPIDAKASGVKVTRSKMQKLSGSLYLWPVQPPVPTSVTSLPPFVEPIASVYESTAPYPGKLGEIISDRVIHGYHLITVKLYPFEYSPMNREVSYSDLDFSITYNAEVSSDVKPLYQSIQRAEQSSSFIKSIVKNPADVDKFGSNVQYIYDGKQAVKSQPIVKGLQRAPILAFDDRIPDYIIITNNALKPTFKTLADWKTKKGVYTIIKTTEEIATAYSGFDLQEKIRNYLKEANSKWGGHMYVLLGGDVNVIPVRKVPSWYTSKEYFAADSYFEDFSASTWNSNNDFVFGDNFNGNSYVSMGAVIGRASVQNITEASIFVNKIINYERAINIQNVNYFKNNLYVGAYLGSKSNNTVPAPYLYNINTSSSIKTATTGILSRINSRYMFENNNCAEPTHEVDALHPCAQGDQEFEHDSFLNNLNTGGTLGLGKFHFIFHVDHSSTGGIGTSQLFTSRTVKTDEIANLNNGSDYQILMSDGCNSANFSGDCCGESYIKNPNGGGVAWIGNTDYGRAYDGATSLTAFINYLYKSDAKGSYDIGSAFQTNTYGIRYHLIGDPEMQVWTDAPKTLDVTVPPAIVIGQQNISVKIANLTVGQTATICIQKGTEVYERKKITKDSTYIIPVTIDTPGDISVCVTAHNYLPVLKTITANASASAHLYIKDIVFDDDMLNGSKGNGDQVNNPGETVQLNLIIGNTGVATATNTTATLACNLSTVITIPTTNNKITIATLASGNTITSKGVLRYTINKTTLETLKTSKTPIKFTLTFAAGAVTTDVDSFKIDILKSNLIQGNKIITTTSNGNNTIEAGDSVTISLDISNIGNGKSSGIKTAVLSRNATKDTKLYIASCSATPKVYKSLNKFETGTATFGFRVANTYPATKQPLCFNLKLTDSIGVTYSYSFDLNDKPAQVLASSILTQGEENSIALYQNNWTVLPTGTSGYNLYRAPVDVITGVPGTYVKVNKSIMTTPTYKDENLSALSKYSYKYSAVSTTGNEGEQSAPILAWTVYGQKKGWPVNSTVYSRLSYGMKTVDFNNDGFKEIFATSWYGNLVEFDYTGKELFDIDNNITSVSGFAKDPDYHRASPAIGDLQQNGNFKFIVPTLNIVTGYDPALNKLYCFSIQKQNNQQTPNQDWSITTPNQSTFRAAVLSNIDNSEDGSLETVVGYLDGSVSTFDTSGKLLASMNGGGGSTLGAIAVADIDNDGNKEIIQSSDAGIYVWHHDGSNYMGINPLYSITGSGYLFGSSVTVADIDNDGKKEILTCAKNQITPYQGKIYAVRNDGTLAIGWGSQLIPYKSNSQDYIHEIVAGDLNHDGKLEVVTLGLNKVNVYSNSGSLISSTTIPNLIEDCPILADVDNDTDTEIICSSQTNIRIVNALNMDGSAVVGFPVTTIASGSNSIPCVSDIDNDGKNELIFGSEGLMNVWATDGKPSGIEWGSERFDARNTGEYRNCNPKTISTSTVWDVNTDICSDYSIETGATLTITKQINVVELSKITVKSGATLIIDGGKLLNTDIEVLSGGNLIFKNNGKIRLSYKGNCTINQGANIDFGVLTPNISSEIGISK